MLEEAEDTPRRMDDVTAELAEQLERWGQRMMETIEDKFATNFGYTKDIAGAIKKTTKKGPVNPKKTEKRPGDGYDYSGESSSDEQEDEIQPSTSRKNTMRQEIGDQRYEKQARHPINDISAPSTSGISRRRPPTPPDTGRMYPSIYAGERIYPPRD